MALQEDTLIKEITSCFAPLPLALANSGSGMLSIEHRIRRLPSLELLVSRKTHRVLAVLSANLALMAKLRFSKSSNVTMIQCLVNDENGE